jgi:hypothetical protein
MPWGINIYQAVSFDIQTENAQLLPSYIYYGVADKESVIVSKLGVPRFAVHNVVSILKEEYAELPISTQNMEELKSVIGKIRADDYHVEAVSGKVIKEIVDRRIGS